MKINDKVIVRNVGVFYPNYKEFFKVTGKEEYLPMWVENKSPVLFEEIYEIKYIDGPTQICIISNGVNVFLIKKSGLLSKNEILKTNNYIYNIECPYCQEDDDKPVSISDNIDNEITLKIHCESCNKDFWMACEINNSYKLIIKEKQK